ncbi:MAG: hypothetical protein M1572_02530 [Gammaproteobacteria bacterium]|nr:hypothetical protein [Gammaproteobacteria bacterium]
MSNVIKFKKPRIIDYINGEDADYLEKRASIAGQAFDDGKLIENLQNDANHEIYDALFMCVQATFQRARAFREQEERYANLMNQPHGTAQ